MLAWGLLAFAAPILLFGVCLGIHVAWDSLAKRHKEWDRFLIGLLILWISGWTIASLAYLAVFGSAG